MKKRTYILIVLVLFLFVCPSVATSSDDSDWTIYFRPSVRWGTDNRVLYTLDFLVPIYQGDKNIVFFNPRFTPDNQDGWETNLGIGYRHLLFNDKLILGLNTYYDTRKTGWGTYWSQWGVGTEVMFDNGSVGLTGRFNYYVPISSPKISGGSIDDGEVFWEDGIYQGLESGSLIEESLEGFDTEAGFRVPYISKYVETWVYGGYYHYRGKYADPIDGFSARLEVIPTDFIRLNYEYREDTINKGEHYGEVAFEVPFSIENLFKGKNPFESIGNRLSGSRTINERLVEPTRRDVDIVVKVMEENGGPGFQYGHLLLEGIVFVSETGDDVAGNGTFRRPYKTIDRAMHDNRIVSGSCDVIHVMNTSTGLTAGGGSVDISGITVWGAGIYHPRFHSIRNFMLGYPTIDSTLTLSTNNLSVMGISSNVAHDGILITGNTGISITDNIISSKDFGIHSDVTGSISDFFIANNNITVDGSGLNSHAAGIYLNATGNIFAEIAGNDMSGGIVGTRGSGGIYISSSNGSIGSTLNPINISNNVIDVTADYEFSHGIHLDALSAGSDIYAHNDSLSENTITATLKYDGWAKNTCGFYIEADDYVYVDIVNNDLSGGITGAEPYGVCLMSNNYVLGSIRDNNMSGGITGYDSGYGAYMYTGDFGLGGIGTATNPMMFTNNTITASCVIAAVGVSGHSPLGQIYAIVLNNTFNISSPDAVYGTYAGYFETNSSKLIGSNTVTTIVPVRFESNTGILTGSNSISLVLRTGYSGRGNYATFKNNSLILGTGSSWGGNYNPGTGRLEVEENFLGPPWGAVGSGLDRIEQ